MTSIVISDRARRRIRELLDDVAAEPRYGLRISVESFGWTSRYQLSLAPRPDEDEVVLGLGDLDAFVDIGMIPLVDGVRIDYVETASGAGFTFDRPGSPDPGPPATPPPLRDRPPLPDGSAEEIPADLRRRIEAALDDIRPVLRRDGGDVSLVGPALG